MNESFLHYLWQHQYFDHQNLRTTDGRNLVVVFPGFYNTNSGPDFFQCRIQIDEMEWFGAVEIHLKSSHFLLHGHHQDPAYHVVVLHVVWENDKDITLADGYDLPVLELRPRVPVERIQKYDQLIYREDPILCASALSSVSPATLWFMIGQAAARRMEQKTTELNALLLENHFNWEEVAYRLLVKAFGLKVNGQAFLRLSTLLPLRKIMRLRGDRFRMESALFGVAGILAGDGLDAYHKELQREFEHLRKVLRISFVMSGSEWKFMRMRPRNFPTIRLAQLAAFLDQAGDMLCAPSDQELLVRLQSIKSVEPSDYWKSHYRFGVPAKNPFVAKLGKKFMQHCLINIWAPLCLARSGYHSEPGLKEWVVSVLQQVPPENNRIVRDWQRCGLSPANAFESQGLLHQYEYQCARKKCLECEVGLSLLGRPTNVGF